ncbi:Hypothetical predicted protein [Paramuricea clavata]|uniref:Uncharacterized protein n=1 Tax=Paramuricea clavata TaxID=317549 RepID=A0A6S7K7J6_PARCT|nr:Hypothetical predicted protein [Paramuricea clavata]
MPEDTQTFSNPYAPASGGIMRMDSMEDDGFMVIKKSIFFESDFQDQEKHLREWRSFKFELIELRKKWLHFKDQVIENKLKLKYTAMEWVLCQILDQLQEEFIHFVAIAKTALVAPVSNAWSE